MFGQEEIEKVYVFVVTDEDGTKGIPALNVGGTWMPMIAADESNLHAMKVALSGLPHTGVELLEFSNPTLVETIAPTTGGEEGGDDGND